MHSRLSILHLATPSLATLAGLDAIVLERRHGDADAGVRVTNIAGRLALTFTRVAGPVTVTDTAPVSAISRRFLRLRASLLP